MLAYEPFGVARVGGGEDVGAGCLHRFGVSIVDIDGVVPRDVGVVVLGVVPAEEVLATRPRVFEAAEAGGKSGRYFNVRKCDSE